MLHMDHQVATKAVTDARNIADAVEQVADACHRTVAAVMRVVDDGMRLYKVVVSPAVDWLNSAPRARPAYVQVPASKKVTRYCSVAARP
jgi:hypothetical protein